MMEAPLPNTPNLTPPKALVTIRLIWAAMLMAQIMFMIVVAIMWESRANAQVDPQVGQLLFYVALAMLGTAVPVGYFVRGQVYKKNWRGDVVTPQGYITGNVVLLALCEGVSLTGLMATMVGHVAWYAAASLVAMAVQVINFPHGGPMQPNPLRTHTTARD